MWSIALSLLSIVSSRNLQTGNQFVNNTFTARCEGLGCLASQPCIYLIYKSSACELPCTIVPDDSICAPAIAGQNYQLDVSVPTDENNPATAPPLLHIDALQVPLIRLQINREDFGSTEFQVSLDIAFRSTSDLQELIFWNVNVEGHLNQRLPSSLTTLEIRNSILMHLPDGLSPALRTLIVTNSGLEELPSDPAYYNSLQEVRTIDFTGNRLTNYQAKFSVLERMILNDNEFTEIPKMVFDISRLDVLRLLGNPIERYNLTEEEFDFLRFLIELELPAPIITDCGSSETRLLENAGVSVCITNVGNDSGDSEDDSNTIVVVIVSACIAAVMAGLFAFWCWRRKNSEKSSAQVDTENLSFSDHYEAFARKTATPFQYEKTLHAVRIPMDSLKIGKTIYTGDYGTIRKGLYKGNPVAIKCSRMNGPRESMNDKLIAEIEILSSLDHPNIVTLIGAAWTSLNNLSIITELAEHQDLHSFLQSQGYRLSWPQHKIHMAIDIAQGLNYLHTRSSCIIYCDLKGRNVLVTSSLQCKLADFGDYRTDSIEYSKTVVGTLNWIAPEVALGQDFDQSADIYSFGLILYELITHKIPFQDAVSSEGRKLTDAALAIGISNGKVKLSYNTDEPASIIQLSRQCIQYDPSKRPSAAELVHTLTHLSHQYGQ